MDISAEIAAIQAASQGSELRQPLVGALNKLNSGSLPAVTASDAGKILKVGANGWEVGEKSGYTPITQQDEGKVVLNGALAEQTVRSAEIVQNGTYNTTYNNSVTVNVPTEGGAGLPFEYQEVEYIRSSGTQYIDTGIVPTRNTRVKAMTGNCTDDSVVFIIGSRSQSVGNNARFAVIKTSALASEMPHNNYFSSAMYNLEINNNNYSGYFVNRRHLCCVNISPNTNSNTLDLEIDNSYNSSFPVDNNFIPVNPIYLFASGDDNNTASYLSSVDIYFCKIYDANGNVVRDFIPCYRKSDNVIGMYDLANNVFYTNNGTGTFSKGENV